MSIMPDDFGEPHGTEIDNKNTILSEIDQALNEESPDLEYIWVKPWAWFKIPLAWTGIFKDFGIHINIYGHSALRYKDPDGNDVVVNIEGKKNGVTMIRFYDPKEYFYGTDPESNGEQKGVYNRSMIGIRVQNVPLEDRKNIHEYFLRVQEGEQNGEMAFHAIFGPFINTWNKYMGHVIPTRETGNCSRWISSGLYKGNIVTDVSMWPKSILVNILENYGKGTDDANDTNANKKQNIKLVHYERPKDPSLAYGVEVDMLTTVRPLNPMSAYAYGRLGDRCHCTVQIPENTIHANVILGEHPIEPNEFRDFLNHKFVIGMSVIGCGILGRKAWRSGWGTATRVLFRKRTNNMKNDAQNKMNNARKYINKQFTQKD
jgi:hypothetical protein